MHKRAPGTLMQINNPICTRRFSGHKDREDRVR